MVELLVTEDRYINARYVSETLLNKSLSRVKFWWPPIENKYLWRVSV